jgi:hypothetical protein
MQELAKEETWILGNGKTEMTSRSMVKLTFYNTKKSTRTYSEDFYVVDSELFDMVLGVEFFKTHRNFNSASAYMASIFAQVPRSTGMSSTNYRS